MFNIFTKVLIILLPFSVVLSVFFQFKLGVTNFGIFKEVILWFVFLNLIYEFYKIKKFPKFEILDYLIFSYIFYLILISFFNFDWFKAIIYWWRYDFEFLIVFLIFRHWAQFLKEKLSYYIKIFLISWALAIFIWILVRFVFWETILLYLGFSPNLSSWNFWDSIPIYHWIQWANIRRFQWIFDWPNQTAFFLITYLWLFIHYLKNKKDVEIYIFLWIFFILGLILLTYSRSSIVWLGWAIFVVFILNIKKIFIKYKFALVCFLIFIFLLGWAFFIKYGNTTENIILRLWSSKWHFERMIIWFDRFKSNPLWEWLASNWPAFRVTHDISNINESYYIPESWYIQQLVEGWIIWLILFLLVMWLILIKIYQLSIPLFMTFLSVLIMNIFLHSFEAVYVTIILFIFLGIFLKNRELRNKN